MLNKYITFSDLPAIKEHQEQQRSHTTDHYHHCSDDRDGRQRGYFCGSERRRKGAEVNYVFIYGAHLNVSDI